MKKMNGNRDLNSGTSSEIETDQDDIDDILSREIEDLEPLDDDIPQEPIDPSFAPREGRFLSRCTMKEVNGQKILEVPLDFYQWIVCVPYAGHFKEMFHEKSGKMVRGTIPHFPPERDWSHDVDVIFNGAVLPPFKRLELVLDRDEDPNVPRVRVQNFEVRG